MSWSIAPHIYDVNLGRSFLSSSSCLRTTELSGANTRSTLLSLQIDKSSARVLG